MARTSPQKYKSQGSPRKPFNRKKDFSSQVRPKDNADPVVKHVELQNIPQYTGTDKNLLSPAARGPTAVSHPLSQQPLAEAKAMQEADRVDAKAIVHHLVSAEKGQPQASSERAIRDAKSTSGGNSTDTAEPGPTESHSEVCSSALTTSATAPVAIQSTPTKKKGRKQSNIATERSVNEAKQNHPDKRSRKSPSSEKIEDSKQRKESISGFGKVSCEVNVSEMIKHSGTLLDSNSQVQGKDSKNSPELAPSDTTQWPALNPSKSTALQPDVSGREQCGMKEPNSVREVTSSESSGLNFEQLGTKSNLLTVPSSDGQSERLLKETAKESIATYDATAKKRTRHESWLEASTRPSGDSAASKTANILDSSASQYKGKQSSIEQKVVSDAQFRAEESVKVSSRKDIHMKDPVSQPMGTKSAKAKQSHIKANKGKRMTKENASKAQPANPQTPAAINSKESLQKENIRPMLATSVPKSTEGNVSTKSRTEAQKVYESKNSVESVILSAKLEPPIDPALALDQSVKVQVHPEDTISPQKHAIDECIDEKIKNSQDTSDQRTMKSNTAADGTTLSEILNQSKSVNASQVSNKQFSGLDFPVSLATSTAPIYTHKKKQRKPSPLELKSSNLYEALGSETVESLTQELPNSNIDVKGKELQVDSSHLPDSNLDISTGVEEAVSSVNENEDLSTANKRFSGVSTPTLDGRSKSKKKAKKSKRARTSQSALAPGSSDQSSLIQANGSRTLPSVETPFLSDDKTPLPRPVIRNRPSSDQAAKETPPNYQCVFHTKTVTAVEEWLKYRQGNPFGRAILSGDLEDYNKQKEVEYNPELYSIFPEPAIEQDHSAQNNGNTFLPLRSISAKRDAEENSQSHELRPAVDPAQRMEIEANSQVAVQHEVDQLQRPGSNDQENGSTEEQVRSRQVEVDKYLKANGKASREALLRLLDSIIPEKDSSKVPSDGGFSLAGSREIGNVLPEEVDVTSWEGDASKSPRVFEIIDEIPPLPPPPPRSPKQRDIRQLLSRSPSPTVPISRDESEIERPELTPLTTASATPKAQSQPRTLSPEMFQKSTALREPQHRTDDPVPAPISEQQKVDESQVIGASEEITSPQPPTETGSPSAISLIHVPKVKALSYKDVASTPPAPSLQESAFPPLSGNGKGHVGPKAKQENRERGCASTVADTKGRASQQVDPWRVVSTSWGEPTTKHPNS